MMKTYDELCAGMRSWLNMSPDDTRSLQELTEILLRDIRRRGVSGYADSWLLSLAEYIDRERAK